MRLAAARLALLLACAAIAAPCPARPAADRWGAWWIWGPQQPMGEVGFVRKSFTLEKVPAQAWVQMSGDDWYEFYVNGRRVKESGFARGRCDVEEIARYLRPGENVFAAHMRSPVEPAGFLIEAMFCGEGGACRTAVLTDRHWKFSSKEEPGWNAPGFDARAWADCIELARPPSGAWGPLPHIDPRLGLRVVAMEALRAPAAGKELALWLRLVPRGQTATPGVRLNLRLQRGAWVYFTADVFADAVTTHRPPPDQDVVVETALPDYLPAGTYDLRIEQPGAVNEQPDLKVIVKAARRQAGPARAEVRELKPGLPMLFINGRPVYPYVYTPYSLLAAGRVQPEAARLTRGQFAICSFGTNLGWTGEGKYDFGHMDECALTILARDPKAYLLPRVDVSAPPWWCDGHEDQLTRYADGVGWVTDALGGTRHQSFASQLWQQGAEEGLRKLIAHVLASPYRDRVIGYQIGNGIYGEWHYWSPEHMPDTSAPMQGAFDQYLLRKHKQAPGWQIPGERERLESAGMFLDPAKQSRLIDYYQCYQQASSAALLRFCRAVKQAGGGRALAGAFYAYLPDLWWGSEGFQLSAAPVLDSPFIDFLASPHSYAGRYPGQDAGFRAYIGSIRAHGKLFFDEADDRTYLSHAREPFRFTPTPWGSVQLLRREFANALTHNVGLWYFSLEQQFFDSDLFAGEFRRMREIADAAVPFMQPRKPEIAVIADPQALLYVAHFKTGKDPLTFHMFNEQLREIAKAGASNDLYLLSDLCGGLVPEHRMYVFLNTYRMTPRERAAVRARCMRPGKSVVFLGPAGYSDGDAISPQNSSDLTGFEIAQAAGLVALTGKASSGGGILEGLPADYRFGLGKVMDPGLCITGGGECVARYPSGDGCSTAIGQQNGATVILCLTPVLPAAVLRNAARAAGCHIWLGSDDIAYAGAPFLAVHTATAGAKAIRLPVKQAVVDVFARRLISAGCSELNLRLPRHATSLYFLGAPSQARSFLRALAGPGASARNQRPRRSVVSGDAATHAATQRRK